MNAVMAAALGTFITMRSSKSRFEVQDLQPAAGRGRALCDPDD
jgi:hypothetical protein